MLLLLSQIASGIELVIDVYCILIFLWAIVSMAFSFNPRWGGRDHPVMHVLDTLTAPVIRPIQRMPSSGPMDISPLLAIFALRTIGGLVWKMMVAVPGGS
jgi:uncharacterized protein YggT (Ycf19 family)